jgi:virginiamycin B lyase
LDVLFDSTFKEEPMRIPAGICVALALSIPCAPAAEPGGQAKNRALMPPSNGVKAPGVQIPFSALKSEMDFEAARTASWIAVADAILTPGPAKDGLIRIDARSKEKKPADPIEGIKQPCGGLVSAFGSLWVAGCGEGTLSRLDGKTFKVTATLTTGTGMARTGIAATADSVWMLTDARGTLSRIDPAQNQVVAEFRVPADCGSLTFGETALWLACPAENQVLRIDALSNLIEKSIDVSASPNSLVIGENSVWVLCAKDGKVERIDPKTNKVIKTIETGAPATGGAIAFGEGSVWISMPSFPLTRIDPQTDKVVQQFYGPGGGIVQAGLGSVWLADSGKLLRFDPRRIAATLAE